MIKVTANINGEKREITNYSYQCNLRFCDFPNFAQLIMIYKSVKCKEPPVEGDLIALTFDSTGKDSFFYEWIISGDMYDGEIEFVCNEVDVVDIFRFWDCYCIGIEESMSIGGAPMSCTVYLSPGIIKRNNLPVREKVWKVTDISQKPLEKIEIKSKKRKIPEIVELYWKDAKGSINIDELPKDGVVSLYAKTINTQPGDKLAFTIALEDGKTLVKIDNCIIDAQGIAKIVNFDLKKYKQIENTP